MKHFKRGLSLFFYILMVVTGSVFSAALSAGETYTYTDNPLWSAKEQKEYDKRVDKEKKYLMDNYYKYDPNFDYKTYYIDKCLLEKMATKTKKECNEEANIVFNAYFKLQTFEKKYGWTSMTFQDQTQYNELAKKLYPEYVSKKRK